MQVSQRLNKIAGHPEDLGKSKQGVFRNLIVKIHGIKKFLGGWRPEQEKAHSSLSHCVLQ